MAYGYLASDYAKMQLKYMKPGNDGYTQPTVGYLSGIDSMTDTAVLNAISTFAVNVTDAMDNYGNQFPQSVPITRYCQVWCSRSPYSKTQKPDTTPDAKEE